MKRKTKAIALLLSAAIICTLFPTGIFGGSLLPETQAAGTGASTLVVDGTLYPLTTAGLSAAVDAAADGDTVYVDGTIEISETITINKTVTLTGSASSVLRSSSNFTGNMLRIGASGNLTLENLTLGGVSGQQNSGSLIYVNGGTLSLNSGTISGNTATQGGAIYNSNGTVNISGGIISGNAATQGGGIYNSGVVEISGGSITGNTSDVQGGGIFSGSSSTVNISDIACITDNTVGGTITDGVLSDGTVNNLFLSAGSSTYMTSSFTGSVGITKLSTGNVISGSGHTITAADLYGVFADTMVKDGKYYDTVLDSVSNQIVLQDVTDQTVIVKTGGDYDTLSAAVSDKITGSDSNWYFDVQEDQEIESTISISFGKAVIFSSSGATLYRKNESTLALLSIGWAQVKIRDITFDGRLLNGYSNIENHSGALLLQTGSVLKNSGAAAVNNSSVLVVSGSTLTQNAVGSGFGAGIYNGNYGSVIMNGGSISDNTAKYGAGIRNNGTFTLNNGTISENTATGSGNYGGGIDNRGILNINGGRICNNQSSGQSSRGGGIFNTGTCNIRNAVISGNSAAYGGGIFNFNSMTISGGTLENNTASYGGGIYNNGTALLSGGVIRNNSADSLGGGVYVNHDICVGYDITVTDNTITSAQTANNLYLNANGAVITVVAELSGEIGLSLSKYRVTAVGGIYSAAPTSSYALTESAAEKIVNDSEYYQRTFADNTLTIEPVPPSIGTLSAPAAIKAGQSLSLTAPTLTDSPYAVSSGWQIKKSGETDYSNFSPDSVLDCSYQNASLRYYAAYTDCDSIPIKLYSNDVILSVAQTVPTVSLTASPASPTSYGQTVTLTATLSGGYSPTGTVTFKNGDSVLQTCAVSNGTATYSYTPAASYEAQIYTAVYSGDSNNTPATSAALSYYVNKASQSALSLSEMPTSDITYGDSGFTVSASGGSTDSDVTYTSSDETVATVSNSGVVTIVGAGTFQITAVRSGDSNYNDVSVTSDSITVLPKTLTVSGLEAVSRVYDGTATVALSGGTLNGIVTGDEVAADIPVSGTIADKNVGLTKAVTVSAVTLTGSDKSNYILTQPAGLTVDIAQKTLSVSVSPVTVLTGQVIPALNVLISGFADGDTADSVAGFTTPSASVAGTVDTTDANTTQFDVHYTGGSAGGNYTFDYHTTASLAIQPVAVTNEDYTADLDLDEWHNTDITLSPANAYTLISTDRTAWQDSLTLSDEGENNLSFYLKKEDGTLTQSTSIFYKIDKTDPTGEITIAQNRFRSFINTITLGLFCKDSVDVSISGADALSGVASVEYQKAASADLYDENGTWTAGDSLHVSANETFVLYARITDNAGNVTVINTENTIVYTDSAADTQSLSYTKFSGENPIASVTLNGNTTSAVAVDGATLTGGQYTVDGGQITLSNDYLDTLTAESHTVTVSYNALGQAYDESADLGEAPSVTTFTVQIARAELTADDFTFTAPDDLIYNGGEKSASVTADLDGLGEITTAYYDETGAQVESASNAGTYTVKISVAQSDDYNALDQLEIGGFAIDKAQQSAPSVQAADCTTLQNDDGAITGADSSMEYQKSGDSVWLPISGSSVTGLTDGTYSVRRAETGNYYAGTAAEVTIGYYSGYQEDTPNAQFDAAGRTLSGISDSQRYRVDGGAWTAVTANLSAVITGPCTLEMYQPGDGIYTLDSEIQTLTITQAEKPEAEAVDETVYGKNDGKITGVDSTMEYQKSGDTDWTAVTGTVLTNLSPGNYLVRVRAAGTVLESDSVLVTVDAADKYIDRTIQDDDMGISVSGRLTSGAQLNIISVSEDDPTYSDLFGLVDTSLSRIISGFDATLTGEQDGALTLSLDLGSGYDGKTIVLYGQNPDGTVVTLQAVGKDGKVAFTMEELTDFVLTTEKEAESSSSAVSNNSAESTPSSDTAVSTSNPKTGDNGLITWICLLLLLSGGAALLAFRRRKHIQ